MTAFLLYGATGYTGQLIARQAIKQGLQPLLGGRTAEKLAPIAAELGLEYRAFALDEPAEIQKALAAVPVLLNCAGPFRRTAPALVEGCLRSRVHYLDLAGEVPEFESIITQDEAARTAGVMVMPGVGFGVVPTDCLAAALKKRLPSASSLALAFKTVGGVSQGTLQTLLKDLHRPGVVRQKGHLVQARPAEKQRQIDFGEGATLAVLNPWRGDLSTAFYTTGIPTIETYTAFPPPLPAFMKAQRALGWLWNSGTFQHFLDWGISHLPAGPGEAELAQGQTYIWGEARNEVGNVVTARLKGPEAYLFTALTALAVVKQVLAGVSPAGFQTPAGVYGAEFIEAFGAIVWADDQNR